MGLDKCVAVRYVDSVVSKWHNYIDAEDVLLK